MKKFVVGTLLIGTLALASCGKKANVNLDEQTSKIQEYANSEKIISVKELDDKLKSDNPPIVIGVINKTTALPGTISGNAIEDAYLVWRPDYSGANTETGISDGVPGYRFGISEMEDLLSKAGATKNSEIVIYSADSHHDSARFMWQVETLGHNDVKILDGGMNAWVGSKMPTGKATRLSEEDIKTEYKAEDADINRDNASIQLVIDALENPDEWLVIDTRGSDEYEGNKLLGGASGKGGLKGAVHIDWTEALTEETLLKTKSELEKIYEDAKGKKVITLCQSGVRSAHTYMVLKDILGMQEVYNYDGSWIEWSYVASSVSDGVVEDSLKSKVKELTTNWSDNGSIK